MPEARGGVAAHDLLDSVLLVDKLEYVRRVDEDAD